MGNQKIMGNQACGVVTCGLFGDKDTITTDVAKSPLIGGKITNSTSGMRPFMSYAALVRWGGEEDQILVEARFHPAHNGYDRATWKAVKQHVVEFTQGAGKEARVQVAAGNHCVVETKRIQLVEFQSYSYLMYCNRSASEKGLAVVVLYDKRRAGAPQGALATKEQQVDSRSVVIEACASLLTGFLKADAELTVEACA